MKKHVWAICAALTGAAAFLRFALRGYAWWGYALLFVAALLLLHRYLPVALWRVVVILVCIPRPGRHPRRRSSRQESDDGTR